MWLALFLGSLQYHNNHRYDQQGNSKDKSENYIHLLYTYLFLLDGDKVLYHLSHW